MATYYVTLPNSGVTAEVTADTTRQARTAYLDYMTRSNQVPWKGRQDLREQLLIDKISPGQVPTDVELAYGQIAPISEETLSIAPDYTQEPVTSQGPSRSYDDYGDPYGEYEDPEVHAPFVEEYEEEIQSKPVPTVNSQPKQYSAGGEKLKSKVVPTISSSAGNMYHIGDIGPLKSGPTSPNGNRSLPLPNGNSLKLGLSGEKMPVNGSTKIARLVKDQFPKGKI